MIKSIEDLIQYCKSIPIRKDFKNTCSGCKYYSERKEEKITRSGNKYTSKCYIMNYLMDEFYYGDKCKLLKLPSKWIMKDGKIGIFDFRSKEKWKLMFNEEETKTLLKAIVLHIIEKEKEDDKSFYD